MLDSQSVRRYRRLAAVSDGFLLQARDLPKTSHPGVDSTQSFQKSLIKGICSRSCRDAKYGLRNIPLLRTFGSSGKMIYPTFNLLQDGYKNKLDWAAPPSQGFRTYRSTPGSEEVPRKVERPALQKLRCRIYALYDLVCLKPVGSGGSLETLIHELGL